jgi:hypothetical protein
MYGFSLSKPSWLRNRSRRFAFNVVITTLALMITKSVLGPLGRWSRSPEGCCRVVEALGQMG